MKTDLSSPVATTGFSKFADVLGTALYGTKGGCCLYSAKKMFILRQLLLLKSQWSHHDKNWGSVGWSCHMWVFSRSSGIGWLCTFRSLRQIFSSVQSLSHIRLYEASWTAACQASLSITNSRSWLQLMSLELVMPSNHLILCCPLLLPPLIFPSIRVFSNEANLNNQNLCLKEKVMCIHNSLLFQINGLVV